MTNIAVLFLIFFTGTQYIAAAPNSGYVYSREANVWLRLHMVPTTWADAGMRCYLEGGVLASPTTSELAQEMVAIMAEQKLTYNVFTGINSILVRENFTSLDGVPLSAIPVGWAAGEPNNDNWDEDCVALTGGGLMADVSCEGRLPYFCRKENVHKCGDENNHYTWEPRTGSCYKFHSVAKTWRKAQSACHAQGGYLAIINSQTESTVLKELYDKNPKEMIVGATEYKHAFIGFQKYYDGEWATVYGDRLADVGFTNWDANEPNNYGGRESCGSIHRNGLLNDAPCTDISPFICEMTAKYS